MGLFDMLRAQKAAKIAKRQEDERRAKETELKAKLFALPRDTAVKLTEAFQGRKYVLEVVSNGMRKFSIHELIDHNGREMWQYTTSIYDTNGNLEGERSGVYPTSFAKR